VNSGQEKELTELVRLYVRTKRLVLSAEEMDPESKSNIAVFKEQRDALDHVMRALADVLDGEESDPPDPKYFTMQLEKARGHLFRAAYDALDGLGVSCKIRIAKVMDGLSNEAIQAVHPQYYDHLVEIEKIEQQIVTHRQQKDVGDRTLENMDAYKNQVEKLYGYLRECQSRANALWEWQRRDGKRIWKEKVVLGLMIALLTALVTAPVTILISYFVKK